MKILITGSKGFIGKNLVVTFKNEGYDFLTFDRDDSVESLSAQTKQCNFIIHLAGVNRSESTADFYSANKDLTETIVNFLHEHQNYVPIIFASSIHATKETDFGLSKKHAEDILLEYSNKFNVPVYIYRLPNLFGKWSKPHYNSVVATWCYEIARGRPITISNPDIVVEFAYIDDVIQNFLKQLTFKFEGKMENQFHTIPELDSITLGELAETIISFRSSRKNFKYPDMSTKLKKDLYSTYLSYLPTDQFVYPLKMNVDQRGSFTEILKSDINGQISVNISKPNITKGQHWHHSKNEKFLVVYGQGVIRFRDIFNNEIIEYIVSGDKLEVIDIPPGYTHNIENIGDTDLVTIMWANELFDPENPDTYYLEV